MLQSPPADQGAGERQKCSVYICSSLIPHAKATELIQPCKCAFHNPAPYPQTAAMFGVAHCKQWQHVVAMQRTPDVLCVVGAVSTTQCGRQRGLPRGPWSGGIPSSSAKACVES